MRASGVRGLLILCADYHAWIGSQSATSHVLDALDRRDYLVNSGLVRWVSVRMNVQILIVTIAATSIGATAFAQTQPTRPSAYPTMPTFPSAFATAPLSPCYPSHRPDVFISPRRGGFFDPANPCYSGTIYPSFSAVAPFEFPRVREPKRRDPKVSTRTRRSH